MTIFEHDYFFMTLFKWMIFFFLNTSTNELHKILLEKNSYKTVNLLNENILFVSL